MVSADPDIDPGELIEQLRRALRASERRFEAIVGALSDPVTIRSRDHQLVYANPAALSQLGMESIEQLRSTPPAEIMSNYRVLSADGREITMSEIPSVRILSGEQAAPLLIQTVNRTTGVVRWSLLKAAAVFDEQGEVEATITLIEDLTEQQRAERNATFLSRASDVLASSLDYERTLTNVAQLVVPEIVDWCAVDLFDERGDRIPVAVAHVDPARVELARQLREYQPGPIDRDRGLGLVLRTGKPVLYPEVPDELLAQTAVDEHHLELLRAVEMRSVAIVPMRAANRTFGAMTLVSAESGRVLDRADMDLAEQIAARAAVAIENARLFSERSRIAHTLQQSLLPERLPEIPGHQLAAGYVPAVVGTEVGGDFYDVWPVSGGWMVAIGDVTGKGIEAAALTSLVRHTLRTASEFVDSPAELITLLDRTLKRQPARSICTVLCVRLGDGQVVVCAGGHPLPLLASGGQVAQVGEHGPLLGGFESAQWSDTVAQLAPNSTLLLYTDGVTEALGKDATRFGAARLKGTLRRYANSDAEAVIGSVTDAVAQFQTDSHTDDMALVAIRRTFEQ